MLWFPRHLIPFLSGENPIGSPVRKIWGTSYLRQARAILAARPALLDQGPTGLPPEFEALRWFPLPPACLQSQPARTAELG